MVIATRISYECGEENKRKGLVKSFLFHVNYSTFSLPQVFFTREEAKVERVRGNSDSRRWAESDRTSAFSREVNSKGANRCFT